ncbi:Glucans biosynthesis protein C [Aquisphaera giovannonii]|uniref:Glucans biosynthesis protein C n=1 Tax=Aquisphaera giovannonii TaxID=406548 RepID=A0A5B9WCR7_9BACT|nr:acyltransferase family protein [Aquisphaera giovannonii]QEH38458.1 Glucans biosynthesis protein C [Aquisphaera giovannonii]
MPSERAGGSGARYHSLDGLRAAAMLAGVFYHAVPGFGPGAASSFAEWLHSFRMPLFMLISGFFGLMILEKYGLRRYLTKRWWRIGLPMLIGLFTFMPIYSMYGPMAGMFPGPGGPDGPPGFDAGPPRGPGGPPGFGEMPPPPPGMMPPFLQRFDADGDGSLSEAEWKKVREEGPSSGPPGGGPGGPPGFGPPGFGPPGFGGGSSSLNRRIFGETGRLFSLGHLWFLWYLLVFVTAAPAVSAVASWTTSGVRAATERLGGGLVRLGLAPLVLALVSLPLMMLMPSFMGWGLPLASGIGGQFPDFFFQYEPDWPYYFAYFMAGWWLYSRRVDLPAVGRTWLPMLALGVASYVAFRWFSDRYQRQTGLPHYGQLRILGYGLYAVGSALTSWGLVGLFQRNLDRPSRPGRYFSETALWIYLVHQDILGPVMRGLRPLRLEALPQGLLATALTIGIAVALYELLIRRTPLVWVFGPGRPRAGREEVVEPAVPADEIVSENGSEVTAPKANAVVDEAR